MPRLLLNLRNVPDDEIEEVRSLMNEHGIECYDTPPGPFGITAGGIWLKDPDDYARARELMDSYQAERAERARAQWQAAHERGEAETLSSIIRRHPLKTLLIVAGSIFVLMVLFSPLVVFFRAGG
ncbi:MULTISPECIES: DUF6164 family protein [unclassified Wenzhouxiangella]|uniref:DUF6164 family protein n=1 Tax=unclassified Wenzhouxiangella TaxID=2613841 RepID=UPI000E328FB2|nr:MULTISPECIES: DUF6164 family protein [unclassified Wenzhouxiangella]RFF27060.1 hypothetical protein DZK25_09745 [Wenzhouxiangella sp. 15181]RFP67166.1 hypothetical protein DZK26_13950 [Wenzhouxiangella sp. 15190]